MGKRGMIRPALMSHLIRNAGKPVQVEDLTSITGVELTQIQAAMRNIILSGEPVRTIVRARVWVYEPETGTEPEPDTADPTGEIFEGVGRTRSGAIIVRDGNGVLYVAREMDLYPPLRLPQTAGTPGPLVRVRGFSVWGSDFVSGFRTP